MFPIGACAAPVEAEPAPSVDSRLELPAGHPSRWADLPVADGFGWPVVETSRVVQGYGQNAHLGLDINARGACDDDLGVPVVASATGTVALAADLQRGWGNVVVLVHRTADGWVQTLYGHLDRVDVTQGAFVRRGEPVGTIGDAHGAYCAHLHFELRLDPDASIGGGYGPPTAAHRDPAAWLADHAPTAR